MKGAGWISGGVVHITLPNGSKGIFGAADATPTVSAGGAWQTTVTVGKSPAGSYTFTFAETGCTSQTGTFQVTASPAPPPACPSNPTVAFSPSSGHLGTTFTITGSGWVPGGKVTGTLPYGSPGLFYGYQTPTVNASGGFSHKETVGTGPAGPTPPGTYTFTYAEKYGGCSPSFRQTFTVTPKPPPPPPAAHCPSYSASTWAGYAVCGKDFTKVEALWTVPAAHGGGNKGSAFWVGLGGISGSLEQIGTTSDVVNGKAVYGAWWEFVPGGYCGTFFNQSACSTPPVFLAKNKYPVHAGDTIAAVVRVAHGDQYYFDLADYSAYPKWVFSLEETNPGGTQASAEVITEDSDGRNVGIPLTDFGTVTFSQVAVNNNVMEAYNPTKYMLSAGRVSVSTLGDTALFSITYEHS